MDDTNKTTAADALDQAAAEAVESQKTDESEEVTEQTTEEPAFTPVAEAEEQTAEELDDEGLPKEHKERSDLGRKVSAVHRRMDEMDNKFDRMLQYLESTVKPKDSLEDLDENEPITRKDLERWQNEIKVKEEQQEIKYRDEYVKTIAGLGTDLGQAEYDAVIAEMQSLTYNPTKDPARDAEINFYRAERAYLRKKVAQPQRKNPLKGATTDVKPGVATSQKTVVPEKAMPKLDADAQAYLDYVRRTDGDEKAQKIAKGL